MAFNTQVFKTRTLTAIIFAVVMLIGLLWNHWSFLVLFSIIHFGCWWEYFNLLEKIQNTTYNRYTRFGFMLIGYGLMIWFCSNAYQINGYGIKENFSLPLSGAGFALLVVGIYQKGNIGLKTFGTAALGLVYISLCWGLMMDLNTQRDIHFHDAMYIMNPAFLPLVIIASIWINDTMAYIVGSFIGKTPLSKISPKKTWEGTVGGIILCVLVMFLSWGKLVYSMSDNTFNVMVGLLAGVAAITGTFGDLFESKLKRMAGVKDSGSFMPGHGGFLDRFDSLLFAIPFVWLFLKIMAQ
jgi:phosphatidate cytidylyltransferase